MTRARHTLRHIGLGLLVAGGAAIAQPEVPAVVVPAAPSTAAKASITELKTNRIYVHGIARLGKKVPGVSNVDWSAVSNRLLVDRPGASRFFTVYSMTPEGFRLKPLLLAKPSTAVGHSGAPSWHPSGKYFIFTSQKEGTLDHAHSLPRVGWHNDLWLGDSEGTSFWRLTNESSHRRAPTGATKPSFSPDGSKIFWSGNNGKSGRPPWRQKSLYMADFAFTDGKPAVTNVRPFQPGESRDYYEAYGFSPDGNRVLFAANVISGNPWYDLDICMVDRRTNNSFTNFTDSQSIWDRFATYSPDGKKIIWTSSRGFTIRYLGTGGQQWQKYLKSELWIMDANGKQPKQLTFFNDERSPQYEGRRVFVGDSAFSPDGNQIAVVLYKEDKNFLPTSEIVMLTLGEGVPKVLVRDTKREEASKPVVAPKPAPEPAKKDKNKTAGTLVW